MAPERQPVIGISGSRPDSPSVQAMVARVRDAQAAPLLLANHAARHSAKDIDAFDAIIVMGNSYDIDPGDYIERYPEGDERRFIHPKTKSVLSTPASAARDAYEKQLIDAALAVKMPLFCICGGMQQLNVRLGGTLHQHIPDLLGHNDHAYNAGRQASSPIVPVSIVPETLLARIASAQSLYAPGIPPFVPSSGTVNSFHHQSVDSIGRELIASAYSEFYKYHDGSDARLVEAIERDPEGIYRDQFVLGVQWHPEFLPDAPSTDQIIRDVAMEAQKFAQANDRQHMQEDIERENILSALPIIRAMASRSVSTDISAPTIGGRPVPGRSR